MARRPLSFVCQNCGAVYGRWQGKCEFVRRVEHDFRGRRRAQPAGRRSRPPRPQGPAVRAAAAGRRNRRRPAHALRHRRTRPRHRRRLRAGFRAAGRRRPRHRQVDAADPGRGGDRPGRPPRGVHFRRGGGGAGEAARGPARARGRRRRAGRRDRGGGHRRHPVARERRRAWWWSIPSRPCGRMRSNPPPAR